jgi:uncharacterized protein
MSDDAAPQTKASRPPRGARHRVERAQDRADYDRAAAFAILDAGWLAHVAFARESQPFVIPMLYVREDDRLLLHGSIASRLMRTLGEGVPCTVCVTHLDGLVLARSHFHHSVNYRSVVAFGHARPIESGQEKARALHRYVEAFLPGRAADSRPADAQELAATSVLAFEIEDVSAKVRSGGVKDAPEDLALPYWAGVVPMQTAYGTPLPSEHGASGAPLPAYVERLVTTRR